MTVEEVERRIYRAFRVIRTLPDGAPAGAKSALANIITSEYPPDAMDVFAGQERYTALDYTEAFEVLERWWKCPLDPDDYKLIAFRCGAECVIDGKRYEWSKVRRWKEVAYRFHCHRNTARNRWQSAMERIYRFVFVNSG